MKSGNLEAIQWALRFGTMKLLRHLMTADPIVRPQPALADWWAGFAGLGAEWSSPIQRAIAGGFAADRVAWAFCSGYQAALRALVPGLSDSTVAVLCATEKDGNHPKAIRTTLERQQNQLRMNGHKKWTTLGPAATLLLVVARVGGDESERPALKVVRVAGDAPGVRLQPMPPTRFVPEAPHAEVYLEDVGVTEADVLDGDGYERYLKPFRTVEDIHVQAAIIAYLVREARVQGGSQPFIEQALAVLQNLAALALAGSSDPMTHLLLAGALQQSAALFARAGELWRSADENDAARLRWARDASLLQVAGSARELRRQRAWQRLAERQTS
jgi:acyl-CoA dehydrogenase